MNEIADGWYMITNKRNQSVVYRVVGNMVYAGVSVFPVETYLGYGHTLDRVEVCDIEVLDTMRRKVAEYNELTATIATLRAQVAQQDKDWLAMMRAIVALEDAVTPPDDWKWGEADDEVLLEEFDPWNSLKVITGRVPQLEADNERLRAQVAELQDALGASESWAKASQETVLRQGRDLAAIDLDLERLEQLEADNERLRAQVASLVELNERNCEDALRIINGNKNGLELAVAAVTELGKREQYIKQLEAELQQRTEEQG